MRTLCPIAVLLAFLVAAPASAQEGPSLEVRGAFSLPFGDFASDGATQIGVGAGAVGRFPVADRVAAYLAADRSGFEVNPRFGGVPPGRVTMSVVAAGAELRPGEAHRGPVQASLFAGGTLNRSDSLARAEGGDVRARDRWRPGVEGGVGARVWMSERGALLPSARLRWHPVGVDGGGRTGVTYLSMGVGFSLAL